MKIQWHHEFQKRRRRSIYLRIIRVLECFLRAIKGHRSRISMFTIFAWLKMEELYLIAVSFELLVLNRGFTPPDHLTEQIF